MYLLKRQCIYYCDSLLPILSYYLSIVLFTAQVNINPTEQACDMAERLLDLGVISPVTKTGMLPHTTGRELITRNDKKLCKFVYILNIFVVSVPTQNIYLSSIPESNLRECPFHLFCINAQACAIEN